MADLRGPVEPLVWVPVEESQWDWLWGGDHFPTATKIFVRGGEPMISYRDYGREGAPEDADRDHDKHPAAVGPPEETRLMRYPRWPEWSVTVLLLALVAIMAIVLAATVAGQSTATATALCGVAGSAIAAIAALSVPAGPSDPPRT